MLMTVPQTSTRAPTDTSKRQSRRWTHDEHAKFLRGLELFPHGPWSRIAALVGTRTTRQTMTHAQKYRERMTRRAQEVHAVWDAHGQSASYALLQETVRDLPPPRTPPCSSDEEAMEDVGLGELDELDLRILLSLLSPETDDHMTPSYSTIEPLAATESHDLDHTIWSFLAEVPGDLTQFPDDL